MKNEDGKQNRHLSRRDFLVGSSSAAICGAIGSGLLTAKAAADISETDKPRSSVHDASGETDKWPYPIKYGEETEVVADVLVLGGGVAGCHAAINAAKRGAKVVLVDKGPVKRSGCSGAGVDHWHCACTNPCSQVAPEEMLKNLDEGTKGGAMGYVLKNTPADEVADAIRSAYAGQPTLAPEATQALIRAHTGPKKLGDDLSSREIEVLALLVKGLSNEKIAERLVISPGTVRHHVSACISKLGASNRTHAAALAVEHGLTD